MVLDPRRRQKKLERKAAKRRAQSRAPASRVSTDLQARFFNANAAPVLHSLASDSLWKQGIGPVMLSREVNDRQVAYSVFLVDMYCLGVKNALWNVRARGDVESLVGSLAPGYKIVKLKPECTRNLVQGAVDYARNLGFEPHPDYQLAKLIFGDIDASACTETFVYGHEGKPLFIAGPNDSSQRCRQIVNRLNSQLGPQGHHFIMPLDDADSLDLLEAADIRWDEDE